VAKRRVIGCDRQLFSKPWSRVARFAASGEHGGVSRQQPGKFFDTLFIHMFLLGLFVV
jgi:hypothetical protein